MKKKSQARGHSDEGDEDIEEQSPRKVPEPGGADSTPQSASPICRLPRQPPVREAVDPDPEEPGPLYLPMIWLPPRGDRRSLAVAAFRLGHLSFSMWSWAELLWDEFARRDGGSFHHDGSFNGVQVAAEQLLEACFDLVDSIPPGRLTQLTTGVDRFVRRNDQLVEQYERGTLDQGRFRQGHRPWESVDRELRVACERILDVDHPLRSILELGIAFGTFDNHVTNYYSFVYLEEVIVRETIARKTQELIPDEFEGYDERPEPDTREPIAVPLPGIHDLATRASLVPDEILEGSPLLRSLARIAVEFDRIGDEAAIRRYFEENRDYWSFLARREKPGRAEPIGLIGPDGEVLATFSSSRDPDRDFDSPLTLREMAFDQVRQVEEDLARIPDSTPKSEHGNEIRWDEGEGKLRIGSDLVCTVGAQAINIRRLLKAFEEASWPEKINNPFLPNGNPDPSKLDDTLKELRKKTEGRLSFSRRLTWVHWSRL